MDASDAAIEAVQKLKTHEQAIGRLYAAYAERFPAQAAFWSRLADEERRHAHWIGTLQARMHDDPRSLITHRFPSVAVERSIAFVEKLIAQAEDPDLTAVNAVSAALNLEQALLENQYFKVFETDGAEERRILERLQADTRAHLAAVTRTWRDMREKAAEPV